MTQLARELNDAIALPSSLTVISGTAESLFRIVSPISLTNLVEGFVIHPEAVPQ